MIYTRDLERSLHFYSGQLGFRVISKWGDGYARLRSPSGTTSIALHVDPKLKRAKEGLRLYFEVKGLDALCAKMARSGVKFTQKPKDMEWGWRHAYLKDPDGHELSLYASRGRRLRPD
jgi:catechol 2,3-dioxygenase-like lactoylglutathione lyase family enzyme